MKEVSIANLAKKISCSAGVELVLGHHDLPFRQSKIALVKLHHQRTFPFTDGATEVSSEICNAGLDMVGLAWKLHFSLASRH